MHDILIIGVGSIGERHLRCFQQTGRARLSLCEVNAPLRETIAERYAVEHAYADLDDALAHPHDAAVIATPAPLHVPMARKLAAAGWHLLIEKPLSTSLDGVAELQDAIAKRGVTVAVGYTWRNHPALAAMRAAVQAGRFGKPLEMALVTGQHFPTFRPAYRETYYVRRESGGGAVQDALTHMIDAGQWLLGPIERLAADAAHQALPGVEVEDTVHVIARHGSEQCGQVLASYSLNQHQAPNELTLTLVCSGGTVRCEAHRQRWRWMTEPEPAGQWHDEPGGPIERDQLYITQAQAFLDAMENKRRPLCTLDEGLQALHANLAVLRAVEIRTWVDVHGIE